VSANITAVSDFLAIAQIPLVTPQLFAMPRGSGPRPITSRCWW